MNSPQEILQRIAGIFFSVIDEGEDDLVIWCNVDGETVGLPSNFIAAIRRDRGEAVGDEFYDWIASLAASYRKEDGTCPNVIVFRLEGRCLTAEMKTVYVDAETEEEVSTTWDRLEC